MKLISYHSVHFITLTLLATTSLYVRSQVSAQPVAGTTTTSVVTTEGTLGQLGNSVVEARTASDPRPLRYTTDESTVFVDEAGRPLEIAHLKPGVPIMVSYRKVGDAMIASRVLVRATAPAAALPDRTVVVPPVPAPHETEVRVTTTPAPDRLPPPGGMTTTTWGTVNGFGEDSLVLQSEDSPRPTPYFVSKTTTYVDEDGEPVMADSIRKGAAVTVYATREAGRYVATRVIVKKPPAVIVQPAPAPAATTTVIEPAPVPVPAPEAAPLGTKIIEKKTTTTTTTRK